MYFESARLSARVPKASGLLWLLGISCFWLSPTFAETNRAARADNTFERTNLVHASFPQDKPPCAMETTYLAEPDGGMLEVKLAYPMTQPATNAQGIPYHEAPALPQGSTRPNDIHQFELPSGSQIVLKEGPASSQRPRPKGQLLSVKRHERPRPRPPLNAKPEDTAWKIVITDPTNTVLAGSLAQIKGFSTRPLKSLTCRIRNNRARTEAEPGYITDTFFDSGRWDFTTNWFHWMDAPLAIGTNFVELNFTTESGATVTSNLVLAFLPQLDTTPPHLTIQWPPPDADVASDFLTLRGTIDNESTEISARIAADGRSETKEGLVERNQRFWVEQLPLLGRTNLVTLVAVDSAGNRTTTNFSVFRSAIAATLDPVPPAELWQLQTTVTGTVTPPDSEVMLNGITAQVLPEGRWIANGIPLDLDGVAIFDVVVRPKTSPPIKVRNQQQTEPPANNLHASLVLDTAIKIPGVVLNVAAPTYGSFKLRASGVAGKSFVLLSSPNLVDWSPVLTNLNSAPVFEYADTNAVAHGCRFFKMVPYNEPTERH